jgi:hypothetical protein
MQIAHNGRNSHTSLMADGAILIAPSVVFLTIPALTKDFPQVPAETPCAGDFRNRDNHQYVPSSRAECNRGWV